MGLVRATMIVLATQTDAAKINHRCHDHSHLITQVFAAEYIVEDREPPARLPNVVTKTPTAQTPIYCTSDLEPALLQSHVWSTLVSTTFNGLVAVNQNGTTEMVTDCY